MGLVVIALGAVITFASESRLSYCIKHKQCSADELEWLRLNTKSVPWKALQYSVWIIAVTFQLSGLLLNGEHSLLRVGWTAMMLSIVMTMIRATAATTPEAQLQPAAHPAPLNSEH